MPVFDFTHTPDQEDSKEAVCTYTTFRSNDSTVSPERPMLLLDNRAQAWNHHSCGVLANQNKRTAFDF